MAGDDPYRERGERPSVPDAERRYYTKRADVVKGPFDAEALMRSVKSGRLNPATLVRADDEPDWLPMAHIPRLLKLGAGAPVARAAFDPRRALATADVGRFSIGFLAGFFGGCIGAVLVQGIARGSETKRGAWLGFATQSAVGIALCLILLASHQP